MRSSRPKPLHRLLGRPMVVHVLDSLVEVNPQWVVLVVGHGGDRVARELSGQAMVRLPLHYVEQSVPRGTGDAVAIALSSLPEELSDDVEEADILILPGDIPLLEPGTVADLVDRHRSSDVAATLLTVELDDPTGYGRIVRDRHGNVKRIVEQADATDEEAAVREVNTSVYCFRTDLLGGAIRQIDDRNAQGELYLTDVIEVLTKAGHHVETVIAPDAAPAVGVNDRAQLAAAEAELRRRRNDELMRAGVTMIDPANTYVDTSVRIANDVTLHPGTRLTGTTTVAQGAEIGPDVSLDDCAVGERAVIASTYAVRSTIGDDAVVGPFCRLVAGSEVAPGTTIEPFFSGSSSPA